MGRLGLSPVYLSFSVFLCVVAYDTRARALALEAFGRAFHYLPYRYGTTHLWDFCGVDLAHLRRKRLKTVEI